MSRAGRGAQRGAALGVALLAIACNCSSPRATPPGGGGGGGSAADAARLCDGVRGKVEQLYRAEAEAKEPKRVEEAVADNTAMVMNDCAKAPGKVAPCVSGASTVADLEARCLLPLDDEGTEGEELRR